MTKINLKDYNLEDKEIIAVSYYTPLYEIVFYIYFLLYITLVTFTAIYASSKDRQTFYVLFISAIIATVLLVLLIIIPPKSICRLSEARTVLAYNKEKERIVICFRNGKVTETYAKTITKIRYNDLHLVVDHHIFAGKSYRTTYSSERNKDGSGKIMFKYIDNKKVNRRFKAHVEYASDVCSGLTKIVNEVKNKEGNK